MNEQRFRVFVSARVSDEDRSMIGIDPHVEKMLREARSLDYYVVGEVVTRSGKTLDYFVAACGEKAEALKEFIESTCPECKRPL